MKRKRYSRKCNLLALQPKRFQQIALEHRRRYGYRRFREVMLLQGSLSIERMCQLVPVSHRSSIDRGKSFSRRAIYDFESSRMPVLIPTGNRTSNQELASFCRRQHLSHSGLLTEPTRETTGIGGEYSSMP